MDFEIVFLSYNFPFDGIFIILIFKSLGVSDASEPYRTIGEILFSNTIGTYGIGVIPYFGYGDLLFGIVIEDGWAVRDV